MMNEFERFEFTIPSGSRNSNPVVNIPSGALPLLYNSGEFGYADHKDHGCNSS